MSAKAKKVYCVPVRWTEHRIVLVEAETKGEAKAKALYGEWYDTYDDGGSGPVQVTGAVREVKS